MTHALKTWTKFYEDVESGDKNFEVRKFDRPFKVGDTLLLQDWDERKGEYTGRETVRIITYILSGGLKDFGIIDGFCVLGMKEKESY